MPLPLEKRVLNLIDEKTFINTSQPSIADFFLGKLRKKINKIADNTLGEPIARARRKGPSGGKILYSDDKRYKR